MELGICHERFLERLSRLQEVSGGSLSVSNCFKDTALHNALDNPQCSANDIRMVLSLGVSVNTKDARCRNTPLHTALLNHMHKPELIIELLSHGADVKLNNRDQDTPLHMAVARFKGDLTVIREILKCKPDLKALNRVGKTPLHIAACKNEVGIIDELVKNGGDVNFPNFKGESALSMAVKSDCNEAVRRLLQLNGDPNSCDKLWNSCIHDAASNSNVFTFELLLKYGATVKTKNRGQDTPLHLATRAIKPSSSIIETLLKYGGGINVKNADNKIPFNYMIKRIDYPQCAELLVKYTSFIYFDSGYENLLKGHRSQAFLEACISEIISMNNCRINEKFSLYDIAYRSVLRGRIIPLSFEESQKVFDNVIGDSYPLTNSLILTAVNKDFILNSNMLTCLDIYSVDQHQGKAVKLDMDAKHLIFSYLHKLDLVHVIQASRLA